MSDIISSLPVRTENPGDLEVRLVDGLNPAQKLVINPDGSVNTTISATDLDIRDLAFSSDKVDVSGSSVSLDAPTLAALESITVQNGPGAASVNIQDGGNSITVDAVHLDIRNLQAAQDSVSAYLKDASGIAYSTSNPLPVVPLESLGEEINNFQESVNVNLNASQNHDYTVAALKTLQLTQIEASASGIIKIEVQIESSPGSNSFSTKFVKFNSTTEPNISVFLKEPIAVPAGTRVRVIKTNRDKVQQSIYSTICGHEV